MLYSNETPFSEETDLDLDKSWHAIHFLLTGKPGEAPPPLGNAVLGGTPIGADLGYGPTRYLTPEQVYDVTVGLATISRAELLSRFKAGEFEKNKIYSKWDESPADFEYIGSNYERLIAFFSKAAQAGDAILIYIV